MTAKNALAFPDVFWKRVPLKKTPAIQESTHLCIIFIMWFFVFTKLQPQEVLFSPSPLIWVKEYDGLSYAGDSVGDSLCHGVVFVEWGCAGCGTRVRGIIFCLDHLLAV